LLVKVGSIDSQDNSVISKQLRKTKLLKEFSDQTREFSVHFLQKNFPFTCFKSGSVLTTTFARSTKANTSNPGAKSIVTLDRCKNA